MLFYTLSTFCVLNCVHACAYMCKTSYAQLSWMTESCCGGSARGLTPVCLCAPVMIHHVLQRLALSRREGTNHTPHYPSLVTPKHSGPRTPQPVAVWREGKRVNVCKKEREGKREKNGWLTYQGNDVWIWKSSIDTKPTLFRGFLVRSESIW